MINNLCFYHFSAIPPLHLVGCLGGKIPVQPVSINQDEEIQEINIKIENLSDEISPEESQNLQEVIHHKSGPIREEGADYIIYRPERKQFEKTESGEFQCSDCSYTNTKYSLGRVSN